MDRAPRLSQLRCCLTPALCCTASKTTAEKEAELALREAEELNKLLRRVRSSVDANESKRQQQEQGRKGCVCRPLLPSSKSPRYGLKCECTVPVRVTSFVRGKSCNLFVHHC